MRYPWAPRRIASKRSCGSSETLSTMTSVAGRFFLDHADGVEPAHAGHAQIHEHQIGHQLAGPGDALPAVACLADDIEQRRCAGLRVRWPWRGARARGAGRAVRRSAGPPPRCSAPRQTVARSPPSRRQTILEAQVRCADRRWRQCTSIAARLAMMFVAALVKTAGSGSPRVCKHRDWRDSNLGSCGKAGGTTADLARVASQNLA